jgi:hypothetical protein
MTRVVSNGYFWRLWLPTFLGFPLGGLLTSITVGPIQTPLEALLGGLLSGAVLGLAQWLALRSLISVSSLWIAVTSLGLAVGLTIAVTLFGTDKATIPLLARGVTTGLAVGMAQAALLRKHLSPTVWVIAITLLWPLAWIITSAVIQQNINNDYTVFGASGAVVFAVLSGFLLRQGRK